MTTVQDVIDRARVRHPSFYAQEMPDGAALLFVKDRARTLLLRHAEDLEQLLTVTVVATAATLQESTGYDLPDGTTGYAMEFDGDLVRLVSAVAKYSDDTTGPIELVDQRVRHFVGSRIPQAYISASCLIPMHRYGQTAALANDSWSRVTEVQFTAIVLPELEDVQDDLPAPAVLEEALAAGLAEMMARASKHMAPGDRAEFTRERQETELQLAVRAREIVRASLTNSVIYRG